MDISISPELILARERRGRLQRGIFLVLALMVAATTLALLTHTATTIEYEPICGYEAHVHGIDCFETVDHLICTFGEQAGHVHGKECYEIRQTCLCGFEDDLNHEHSSECFDEERILICELPENEIQEPSEKCLEWHEELICKIDDPEHEHTAECMKSVPVFVCAYALGMSPGCGHVHNDFCYIKEEILMCQIPEHEHTENCYPQLTGDPHADVEMDLDWESTFCNVKLTGNWAEDLIAIAESQLGYRESEKNFVTDEFNVRHGYTRYGDWNGTRYSGWNGLYVMFCMKYADIWGVPMDSVPANWMNAARAKDELWIEAEGEPRRGDLVFFDDDSDGFADRVAIITEVREDGITAILGGTQTEVHLEDFPFDLPNIAGYLALPANPDPPEPDENVITLNADPARNTEEQEQEEITSNLVQPVSHPEEIELTVLTEDGRTVTLRADWTSLPYPAEELFLTAELLSAEDFTDAIDVIEADLSQDNRKVAGAQFYDIAVWRNEIVRFATDPEIEVTEDTGSGSETDFSFETEDGSNAQELPAEEPIAILEEEGWSDSSTQYQTEITDENLPEQQEIIEINRTRIVPEGPYEVIMDGYAEGADIRVWYETDICLTELQAVCLGDSVKVENDLN